MHIFLSTPSRAFVLMSAIVGIILSIAAAGFAQSLVLNRSFAPVFSGAYGVAVRAEERIDGKIVVAGTFKIAGGKRNDTVAVLNADGSADQTFNMPEGPTWAFGPAGLFGVSAQQDNKIVIAGNFDHIGSAVRKSIARLNPDGALDTTFYSGEGFDGTPLVLRALPDGKVLVGGGFSTFDNRLVGTLARLNSDGSLDPSFAPVTATGGVYDLDVQPDGKIVVVGYKVLRLNQNGTVDPTFNAGSGTNALTQSVKILPDGKIVIGGQFNSFAGLNRTGVVRLNPNGSVDTAFAASVDRNGLAPDVNDLDVQANGQIVIGGKFTRVNGLNKRSIARINPDGSTDSSFAADLSSSDDSIFSVKVVQGQKILVGGVMTFINSDFRVGIALLSETGRPESTFDQGVSDVGLIEKVLVQPDGKILVGGSFTHFNGVPSRGLGRINANGTVDPTVNIGVDSYNSVRALGVQGDGKIIVGGRFTPIGSGFAGGVFRINSDGSADNTFSADSIRDVVNDLAIQPNGKIILGGNFFRYVIRLNSDGTQDPQFSIGSGPSGEVYSVALQPDGKILIAGVFGSFNGVNRNKIARLNADGTLDTTFDPGSGFDGSVLAIALQADGKIVCAGEFLNANGVDRKRVARLNADGSVDATFAPGEGANARVRAVAIAPNSDLILGGDFTQFNGVNRSRIVRVSNNGALTADFDQTPAFSYPDPLNFGPRVHSLSVVGDRVLAGGIFSRIDQLKFASLAEFVPAFSTVTGRVFTPSGQALRNATVVLTGADGVRRTATTSSFGVFVLTNVPGGSSYTLGVASKRYRFQPRQINSVGIVGDLVLTGLE